MKKFHILLAGLLAATGVAAQNPSVYFMEGSTLRSQLNPAFAPLRGYVNIPGLGGIQTGTEGNLALDRLLFPRNGKLVTMLDASVSAADALSGLHGRNVLSTDNRINILGFGAFRKNQQTFWSFDLNVRTTAQTDLPYSLFEFLKRGKEGRIRDIGAAAEAYVEAGFAYSFPLASDRLYLGVRGKFLVGLARTQLHYDRFDVSLRDDRWAVDAQGTFDATLADTEVNYKTDSEGNRTFHPDDLHLEPRKPAGYGFAVDLGITYDILPDLQASVALNDFGFISWSKSANVAGRSVRNLEFTGAEVVDGQSEPQPEFDLDILEFEPKAPRSVARMLRASINAGLEYEVWRHKIGFGLLYTAHIREYKTLHNLTASVNFHPVRWFALTGSYSAIDNRAGAVGLALNLCPNWINFFIATDMLVGKHTPQFLPVKQSTTNITLGIGIPIGRRSQRRMEYIRFDDLRM